MRTTDREAPEPLESLKVYDGPAAWTATQMRLRDDWIAPLEAAEIAELHEAVRQSRDTPIVSLTQNDFALPTLGPKLQQLQHAVIRGRGFVLIRGLPVRETGIP